MCKRVGILYKSIYLVFLFTFSSPLVFTFAFEGPSLTPVKESELEARLERVENEAENKANLINNSYNRGKTCYDRDNFLGAIANFKKLLKVCPDYKPARLYLQCAIIRYKLKIEGEEINSIKLKMADIVVDYDKRIGQTAELAVGYLLEQALLRCQAGDFASAEYYYNLCYKLGPQNKEKISWFVDATYELKDLSDSLKEIYNRVEELSNIKIIEELSNTEP